MSIEVEYVRVFKYLHVHSTDLMELSKGLGVDITINVLNRLQLKYVDSMTETK